MAGRLARRAGWASVGMLLAGVVTAGCQPPPYSWDRQLVSQPSGPSSDEGSAEHQVFSPDGRRIAFASSAGDLGPTDTNGYSDVYVRDLVSGTTTLVSANLTGSDSGDYPSGSPRFSPDGTKVAFLSAARNLVNGVTITADWQLYVRDLTTGTTTLASPDADGTSGQYGDIGEQVFTPDGTKLLYMTTAANLGPVDTNYGYDVYMRDLVTGTTTLVSTNAAGTDSGNGASQSPVVTPEGSAVLFWSEASDLGPADTNGEGDVYRRDLRTGETTLISSNAAGTDSANGRSAGTVLSPDGRRVAFVSEATDLGPQDTNTFFDLYVHDLATGATTLASANADGTDAGDAITGFYRGSVAVSIAFSPDGNRLAFESDASNLVTGDDGNGVGDVFVRDLDARTTALVSTNADGSGSGNNWSGYPAFSADGSAVAFVSRANDLGPLDTNGHGDVYVRDLVHGVTDLVSTNAAGDDSADGASNEPVFAPDGTRVAFVTAAKDMGLPGTSHRRDLVVADGRQADLSVTLHASPEPVPSGDEVTYDVEVTSAGPDPAIDARAGLLLPEGATFEQATASTGSCQPSAPGPAAVVTCDLGDLDPDDEVTLTITATVDTPPGTTLTAVAATSSATGDPDRDTNTATHDSSVT